MSGTDADAARTHFEAIRWPNGAYCPFCGQTDTVKTFRTLDARLRRGIRHTADYLVAAAGHLFVIVLIVCILLTHSGLPM